MVASASSLVAKSEEGKLPVAFYVNSSSAQRSLAFASQFVVAILILRRSVGRWTPWLSLGCSAVESSGGRPTGTQRECGPGYLF